MNLRWDDEAECEFSEAAVYYYFGEPGLDGRFIRSVEEAVETIMQDPLRAREFDGHYRKLNTGVFPYQVIYTIEDDTLWIVAVMHQSRKPGYWKGRLKG